MLMHSTYYASFKQRAKVDKVTRRSRTPLATFDLMLLGRQQCSKFPTLIFARRDADYERCQLYFAAVAQYK